MPEPAARKRSTSLWNRRTSARVATGPASRPGEDLPPPALPSTSQACGALSPTDLYRPLAWHMLSHPSPCRGTDPGASSPHRTPSRASSNFARTVGGPCKNRLAFPASAPGAPRGNSWKWNPDTPARANWGDRTTGSRMLSSDTSQSTAQTGRSQSPTRHRTVPSTTHSSKSLTPSKDGDSVVGKVRKPWPRSTVYSRSNRHPLPSTLSSARTRTCCGPHRKRQGRCDDDVFWPRG
mmetsp:Transcript_11389/g.25080  ORF Transcript_11389/g.25080 Transcript_11389/m.25080 type:complete len:236 (-) Transcript_11389:258-965(-)